MQNTKKGFTLIELLIVITIIGILAAALLPSILGAPVKSRDVARQADMTTLVTALEANVAAGGSYPTGNLCVTAANFGNEVNYVPGGVLPTDPSGQTITGTVDAIVHGCGAGEYFYCEIAGGTQTYALFAQMEDPANNNGNIDLDKGTVCTVGSAGIVTAPTIDGYVVIQ